MIKNLLKLLLSVCFLILCLVLPTTSVEAHYCDDYYSDQKDRENCWWRYENDQQSPNDLAIQQQIQQQLNSQSEESRPPVKPLTIVERPTGEGVLTVTVGTDDDSNSYITFGETTHVTHQPDYNQRTNWKPDLNDATEDADTVVINYPTNPADPEDSENYWQAEDEVYNRGEPYLVCFPAETVVVHIDRDGKETTRDYPEECILVTPK